MLVCTWLISSIISITSASPEISMYLNPNLRKDMNNPIELNENANIDDAFENYDTLFIKAKNKVKNDKMFREFNSYRANVKFTDFIQNLIRQLKKFDDTDLETFFSIANDEIRKYHCRGCKFHELTENYELRKYVAKILENNKGKSADQIRLNLKSIKVALKDENLKPYQKYIIYWINSLYEHDSDEKFDKFLTNLEDYKLKIRRNMDLTKIIKTGIKSIIFDHYSKLSRDLRSEFKYRVSEFWTDFKQSTNVYVTLSTNKITQESIMRQTIPKRKTTKLLPNNMKSLYPGLFKQMYVDMYLDIDYPKITDDSTQKYTPKTIRKHAEEDPKTASREQSLQVPRIESVTESTKKPKKTNTSPSLIIEVITLKPYTSKRTPAPKKFKYEILFKHQKHDMNEPKLHLKKPEFQINRFHISNPNEQLDIIKRPIMRHTSVKYQDDIVGTATKSKKITKRARPLALYKGLRSADSAISNPRYFVSHRKSFDNISLLSRIQYLEDELIVAKTQIKNDSKIIKDLSKIMLANQKTGYNYGTTQKNYNEKLNKDVVIDLKINLNDLKNVVSLPPNEMKHDPIKNALLTKLNLENQDNLARKDVERKFNFNQRAYNTSNAEGRFQRGRNFNTINIFKANELNLYNSNNDTEPKYSARSKPKYHSDVDTYERVEERVYDSDSNKGNAFHSDGDKFIEKFGKLTKHQPDKKVAFIIDDIVNKNMNGNDKMLKPYITPKRTILPNTDRTDRSILSVKLEHLVNDLKSERKSDRLLYGPQHKMNYNLNEQFITKPADTPIRIESNFGIGNKYKSHNNDIDTNRLSNGVIYGKNIVTKKSNDSFKVTTSYSPFNLNRNTRRNYNYSNQKLDSNWKTDKSLTYFEHKVLSGGIHDNLNKPLPYKDELLKNKHKNEKVERRIEHENEHFVKTAYPSDVQKRFSTSNPDVEALIANRIMKGSVTNSQYDISTKILKFAKTIP